MEQIEELIKNISKVQIIDIVIAIGIIIFFRIFSSSMSYMIIRMFKFKVKNKNKIKENAFYNPLRIFFILLGFYLGILFLKKPLNIDDSIMAIVTIIFKIVSIIEFAHGLAKSFTPDSKISKKMKERLNKNVEDSMFDFILKGVRVIIYIIAGFIVITQLGINLNGLIAGLGISGVIITLAAQDTAKNLIGGIVIVIDKPFIVGDWIQMDKYEGTVEDITFRSTRIRTFENSVVNVPNATISDSAVINWSKMESRRYRFTLTLELDTPLDKLNTVQERISTMLKKHNNIIDDSIIVKFDTIGDNGINLLICSYTDSVDYMSYLEEKEKINYKILQILKEENVKTAYDTKTVFINHS